MQPARLPQDRLPRSQRQRLVLRMLRRPSPTHLRRLLKKVHPADIAPLFAILTPEEEERLLEALFELRLAGRTLRELDTDSQRHAIEVLPDNRLAVVLTRLSPDDSIELLRLVDGERKDRLLRLVEPNLATRLDALMRFGEGTAGGMMNPDVLSFSVDATVGETLERVRGMAGSGRLFYIYVTDGRGHLLGIVNLWQLVVSNPEKELREILSDRVVSVPIEAHREEVARIFSRYDLLLLPVVDEEGRLVGSITVDDVLDVVEEEAREDLFHLVNLDPQEGLSSPSRRILRLRLPGLAVNLASALVGVAVIVTFLPVVEEVLVLAAVLPLLALLARGTVDQTSAVVVRGMARGEMDLLRPLPIVLKQTAIGGFGGLLIGLLVGGGAGLWQRNLPLGLVVGIALAVSQTAGGLLAASVPLMLSRLELDSTRISSTLVATATQVVGFVVLLGGAALVV